ncbi:helix-turn-helix domain-containing protein [Acetivibrio cellulolyticus]|uniref:helix-turn-helix domain-containing protein n=1 Tax=Acetivibrio cellulolyticus TaxID=35830 RepID=UPI0001E2D085|nr:helix-turn-helix transcriptional regulator [Acetivibrio cellulolyticus]
MIRKTNRFSFLLEKIKQDLNYRDIDLAECLNVTPATISNWVNSNGLPRGKNINKISKILCRELEMRNILSADYCNGCIKGLVDNYGLTDDQIQKIKQLIEKMRFKDAISNIFSSTFEEDIKEKGSKNICESEKGSYPKVNDYCANVVIEYSKDNIETLAGFIVNAILQSSQFVKEENYIKTEQKLYIKYVM